MLRAINKAHSLQHFQSLLCPGLRVSSSEKRNIRTLLTSSHSNTTQKRLLQRQLIQPNSLFSDDSTVTKRYFHASRPNNGWPLMLLATLKSTGFVSAMQVTVRVVLTLLPVVLFRKHVGRKFLRKLDKHPGKFPEWEKYRGRIVKGIKINTAAAKILFITPFALVGLVVFASLERTPITGRLRLMVISPDEEESIVRELSGEGWFEAVRNVLATHRAPPTFVSPSDWRYQWVEKIFRRLESVVPSLQDQELMRQVWLSHATDEVPFPPPPDHPYYPDPVHTADYTILNLPEAGLNIVNTMRRLTNAFSYGFGPNGSGGIVIFSGLIDDILRNGTPNLTPPVEQPTTFRSYLRSLFIPALPATTPVPSPEQEAQLAALVAHELAHLLLSHHLETLSSTTVFFPNIVSIMTDLFRALLFPITMIGGPFLNDALEQVGEAGKREFSTAADSCFSHKLELEADAVSMRLLALAGWDPRAAVDFWETKLNSAAKDPNQTPVPGVLPGALWVSEDRDERSSHPIGEVRIRELRKELRKWQLEKERILSKQGNNLLPSGG
ncbi:hypothetical protein Clacol_002412 [Clathrus columnatus]|uniref:Peptidase M48 domain-containing protein n=1 Tax=Clathrus columnatus TaxID=1419009 RepID=A0AAV5A0T4_9AGAM|nr:hypothetical protein Clacol_002412 [Clathrus columnatus]